MATPTSIDAAGDTGAGVGGIQLGRFGDPVDIDTGERAYVMAVADWKGKKVVTYRFAPTPANHIVPNFSGCSVHMRART